MSQRPVIEVHPQLQGFVRVKLNGDFLHPHWVAFLFTGLAEHGVSVVSGTARQVLLATWTAEFLLSFKDARISSEELDILSLIDNEQLLQSEVPPLKSFELERRDDQGLVVHVQASDQTGFLSRLLGKLCQFGLFPVEMTIETLGSTIEDSIVFRGIAGVSPNEAMRRRLEATLQAAIR